MTRYYYSGGRRIELETDKELVAVDEKAATVAGESIAVDAAKTRRLPGGVTVLPRSDVDAARLERLSVAGALRPVYRSGDTVLVALPEIRVEFENAAQRKAIEEAISGAPHEITVSDKSSTGFVLRPKSGLSDDTLAVANYIYERARPPASSVRFVQFVPKPDVRRKK